MTALSIIVAVLLVIAIIYSAVAVNAYSAKRFRYEPFSLRTMAFVWIPVALVASSLFFVPNGSTVINELKAHNLDVLVLVTTAGLCLVAMLFRLVMKTNVVIGTYAFVIQVLGGAILGLLTLFLIMLVGQGSKRHEKPKA